LLIRRGGRFVSDAASGGTGVQAAIKKTGTQCSGGVVNHISAIFDDFFR
jgi:hypothetical protein